MKTNAEERTTDYARGLVEGFLAAHCVPENIMAAWRLLSQSPHARKVASSAAVAAGELLPAPAAAPHRGAWSAEEDQKLLQAKQQGMKVADIATLLGRPIPSVYTRLNLLKKWAAGAHVQANRNDSRSWRKKWGSGPQRHQSQPVGEVETIETESGERITKCPPAFAYGVTPQKSVKQHT